MPSVPNFLTRTETPPMVGNLWVNVTFYICNQLSNNEGGCEMGLLTQLFLQVAIATQEKYDDSL